MSGSGNPGGLPPLSPAAAGGSRGCVTVPLSPSLGVYNSVIFHVGWSCSAVFLLFTFGLLIFHYIFFIFFEPALPIQNYFSQNKLERHGCPFPWSVLAVYFHLGISIFQSLITAEISILGGINGGHVKRKTQWPNLLYTHIVLYKKKKQTPWLARCHLCAGWICVQVDPNAAPVLEISPVT